MPKRKKAWKSEEEKQKFLTSVKGRAWMEAQMAERRARRAGKPVEVELEQRTKYPFTAIINGISQTVTDREETDELQAFDQEADA